MYDLETNSGGLREPLCPLSIGSICMRSARNVKWRVSGESEPARNVRAARKCDSSLTQRAMLGRCPSPARLCVSLTCAIFLAAPCLSKDDDFAGNAYLRPGTEVRPPTDRLDRNSQLLETNQLSRSSERASSSTNPRYATQASNTPPRPPTYRGGAQLSSKPSFVNSDELSQRWLPQATQFSSADIEANQRPTLPPMPSSHEQRASTWEETDFRVAQANYQDAITPPSLPYNPNQPNASFGSGGGTVMPPSMSAPFSPSTGLPGSTNPSGTSIPSVASPTNLPQYPRASTAPSFVNGAPFVSGPVCEFDAYGMVAPAAYYAPDSMACPPAFGYSYPTPGWGTNFSDAYIPPTLTPGAMPGYYTGADVGYRPLFSLGQENYNVQLGRGIIGQPVAYVQGQPVRNFLRYIFP